MLASLRCAVPEWPLHVIAASDGPFVERARSLGVGTEVLPYPSALARLGEYGAPLPRFAADAGVAALDALRYRSTLARRIAAFGPDVIHTNGLKMHVLASWAVSHPRVVWHLHDYLGSRPITTKLLRMNYRRCAAVVANSASVAADAASALANGLPIVTIANAVDLRRFSVEGPRMDVDAASGLPAAPDGTIRVGLVATFARWKGHAAFIEALAQLARQRQDLPIRGYVIGDSLYQTDGSQYSIAEVRQLAMDRGVGDRIGFTGFAAEPDAAFRALDIVVHASTAPEPFGLVIAEAMACGRPVVVSHGGGAADLVTPGVDALVHRPGDFGDLAAQIARLADDHDLRARLGRAARATAERSFDRGRLAGELIPIYEAAAA